MPDMADSCQIMHSILQRPVTLAALTTASLAAFKRDESSTSLPRLFHSDAYKRPGSPGIPVTMNLLMSFLGVPL